MTNIERAEPAINISRVTKSYKIYARPLDRLKQMFVSRVQKLFNVINAKYYTEFHALKDISFAIKKGETVGIIGRNGSGKSTLLQIICGTLSPSSGSVEVHGRIAALLELGSGFNPEFTGKENVYLNASVLGLTEQEINSKYDSIVSFADIGDQINQPIKTFSSGMVLRLAFSVMAHVDADILIIDEALAVGDVVFTQKCMRFLRQFMLDGTVIFVSHDISEVTGLCSKAILLDKGVIVKIDTAKAVAEKYIELNYQEIQNDVHWDSEQRGHQEDEYSSENQLPVQHRDMRLDFINNSNLRNDIEISNLLIDNGGFGNGGAIFKHIYVKDENGRRLSYVVGGENITLEIAFKILRKVDKPIIGFVVKNRLGQEVFVDNTYLAMRERQFSTCPNQILIARFDFQMPILPKGEYSVSPAIADGDQNDHVQLCWKYDAMILNVHASPAPLGLIGIPMKNISIMVQ